jgi:hypothetical protein
LPGAAAEDANDRGGRYNNRDNKNITVQKNMPIYT